MKYVINLFGTGIRYWDCHVEKEIFDDMSIIKQKHNVEWENLFFDFDFLNHYGFNHWSELSRTPPKVGLLINSSNLIEIKQAGKLITRFKSNELYQHQVLFPLYRTKENRKPEPTLNNEVQLKLIQFEKGLIAKFVFQSDKFSIDTLEFNLDKIESLNFLESICFDSSKLEINLEDTVIVGTKVIL